MLRFPNPSSSIENFVNVYSLAFEHLNGKVVDIDDIVAVVARGNLATSSGHVGAEAVLRSTREDRSRDPMYNQIKMYAELLRMLGWLHPTANSALNYTFTLLGEQVVATGRDFRPILEESALGIAYPTPILGARGNHAIRPFALILRTMAACDGHLSRDEMIIGPLSATNDRAKDDLVRVSKLIANARVNNDSAKAALNAVASTRNIAINTLGNYTRWPIALLRDLGWATKGRATFQNGRSYQTWHLTDRGRAIAQRVEEAVDLRASDVEKLTSKDRAAVSIIAHYEMLERAGFDVTPMAERITAAKLQVAPLIDAFGIEQNKLLFSPFQSLSLTDIANFFPSGSARPLPRGATRNTVSLVSKGRDDRSHLFVSPAIVKIVNTEIDRCAGLRTELMSFLKRYRTVAEAASMFANAHSRDTQHVFYPLVTQLFQILGFSSHTSRGGVNYQRWDAYIEVDGGLALPIEIKSGSEEQYLSTKAIRQALENKIVILSRGGLATKAELSSLVVGYQLPNERGDMSNLIEDIFKTFNFRIGVMDLTTLAHYALLAVNENVTIDSRELSHLKGFLHV